LLFRLKKIIEAPVREEIYQWFIKVDGILDSMISHSIHNALFANAAWLSVLDNFSDEYYNNFLNTVLKEKIKDKKDYLTIVHGILDYLLRNNKQKVMEDKVTLKTLLKHLVAMVDRGSEYQLKEECYIMSSNIIFFFNLESEDIQFVKAFLEKGSNDRETPIKLICLNGMSRILQVCVHQDSLKIANEIFNYLVFCLIEHHGNSYKRHS
jgi:hypothetical protein